MVEGRFEPPQSAQLGIDDQMFVAGAFPHAHVCAVISAYGCSVADDTSSPHQILDLVTVDNYRFGTKQAWAAFRGIDGAHRSRNIAERAATST
jgi:hypothetical protein